MLQRLETLYSVSLIQRKHSRFGRKSMRCSRCCCCCPFASPCRHSLYSGIFEVFLPPPPTYVLSFYLYSFLLIDLEERERARGAQHNNNYGIHYISSSIVVFASVAMNFRQSESFLALLWSRVGGNESESTHQCWMMAIIISTRIIRSLEH